MLLFIALANCAGVVFASQPGVEPHPTGVERWIQPAMFVFVNSHAYPVFAIMFGYGLVQMARRQSEAGASPAQVRSIVVRRNAWLIVFGAVHGALLYYGDFLGAYGVVGVVATIVLLQRSERVHRIVLWLWVISTVYVVVLAVPALTGRSGSAGVPAEQVNSLSAQSYRASFGDRIAEWPPHTVTVFGFVIIVWLGMWGARRRLLEDPAANKRLLAWIAAVGLGIGFAGAVPLALLSAGALHVDQSTADAMLRLHGASGMFAGPGYAALFGLITIAISRRPVGRLTRTFASLGRRSLSGYLFQSIAWLVLLAPYTLDLGNRWGSRTVNALVIGLAIWLVSVGAAAWMDRRSIRGPAESVLRRLTYGRVT
ncbi:DUF418 domain-containing protein [Antrihabitans cavernicola]|uniref:DUF418 domain-containing protein n=2 Tax=Antrihabitans cavernicola TaxID=2495913 RepID=A0A5A7SEM8_9NOCA|nr:DUF418 domain-containing protein [Spelaeibacter cavernicola]